MVERGEKLRNVKGDDTCVALFEPSWTYDMGEVEASING